MVSKFGFIFVYLYITFLSYSASMNIFLSICWFIDFTLILRELVAPLYFFLNYIYAYRLALEYSIVLTGRLSSDFIQPIFIYLSTKSIIFKCKIYKTIFFNIYSTFLPPSRTRNNIFWGNFWHFKKNSTNCQLRTRKFVRKSSRKSKNR